jgi:NAD(P)-dependent dehydrogenase (short-subunit alcohol dehydrogenase family)
MKNVLITGGTKGIGKATAIEFASKGYRVIATTRSIKNKEELEKMFKESIHGDGEVIVEALDVNNEEDVKNLIHSIVEKYGRLDCLVNNAGIMIENVPLHQTTTENFEKIINTDLFGVYYGMKYAIIEMLKQGGGSIVNVASDAGLIGGYSSSLYTAAKHAVVGLTKCGALDYATQGIRVNAVCPGCIKTEIFEDAFKRGTYTEESLANLHPMKRMGTPTEVAKTIFFLAQEENGFTTGITVSVDGGLIAM